MLQKKDEQLAKKDEQLATVLAQHREDLRRKDEQLLDCLAKKDEQYCEDLRRKDEQLERMIQQAVGAHAVQTSPVPTCSPQHQKQHTTEARRAQSSQTQKGEAAPAPVSARNTNKQVLQTDCHVNKDEALLASMLSMQDGDSADDIVDALQHGLAVLEKLSASSNRKGRKAIDELCERLEHAMEALNADTAMEQLASCELSELAEHLKAVHDLDEESGKASVPTVTAALETLTRCRDPVLQVSGQSTRQKDRQQGPAHRRHGHRRRQQALRPRARHRHRRPCPRPARRPQ